MIASVIATQITALQGDGGKPFTAFVDALLRAHGAVHGLPDSDIRTNIRTNIGDQGVDTEVVLAVTGDETGWLAYPTVWQFKGTGYADTGTPGMLDGAHVVSLVENGFAFRLAIADSMPAHIRTAWEARLTGMVRKIRPDAPEAKLVTADDLAAWASRYPGLALGFFRRGLTDHLLHLDAWAANARSEMPAYVDVAEWDGVRIALAAHMDLSQTAASTVQTLQAEAGVGKTRLAFEVASGVAGAKGLVVYTRDENAASHVANYLANESEMKALWVADECGAVARQLIEATLGGHRHRVRVIAIDNTFVRRSAAAPELAIENMSRTSLEAILETNFPEVARERRRAYADLSQGFPRLAADLCRHDARIGRAGDLAPVVPSVAEYLQARLRDPAQWVALAVLSLVTKIGFVGDVKGELSSLCDFLEVDRRSIEPALHALHDGPGFVARAGRYMYVTPGIVARVAFEGAWQRWAAHDAESFLSRIPADLLSSFEERIRQSAPEEVRLACAGYFRTWSATVAVEHLADSRTAQRLAALTETDPASYLPALRRLIEAASLDALRAISGRADSRGQWGARRTLVWLAERLAQFPEHFSDAERVLARLAAAEIEPDISNNATGIWRQLFRVYLSGTATPFAERLGRLRERLRDELEEVRGIAGSALGESLASQVTRTLGPAVVAGRVPPADWRPKTWGEEDDALRAALGLLEEAVSWGGAQRDFAVATLMRHLRYVLAGGHLNEAVRIVGLEAMTDGERSLLLEQLDVILAYDLNPREGGARVPEAYAESVRRWREAVVGGTLHGRLLSVIGRQRWQAVNRRSADWEQEVKNIAGMLFDSPAELQAELPWLTSGEAPAAGELGLALGRIDADGRLRDMLLDTALTRPSRALARGYVHGILAEHAQHADGINAWIDVHEADSPETAVEIAMSAGPVKRALDRALALYDAGRLPVAYLYDLNFTAGNEALAGEDLQRLIERLASAAEDGVVTAARVGLDTLSRRLPYKAVDDPPAFFAQSSAITGLAWRLVEASVSADTDATLWSSVLAHLARIDPARAARLAARAMVSDSLRNSDEAEGVLTDLAQLHPGIVMAAVGEAMLDARVGWKFMIREYAGLFAALPVSIVQEWVERSGVEGARHLARHLPSPRLDATGAPVVPMLTEWVLTKFEDDERTFREFVAGTHSLQMYMGDIAAEHEAEAALARKFLNHPLRRVREWASIEEQSGMADAERARRWAEESDLA